MNRFLIATGVVLLYLSLPDIALGQPRLPSAPTDQELLMLPKECQVTQKGDAAAAAYYKRFQDQGIVGITHYCLGLNFMNRAQYFSLNKTEKRFNLQSAIGEFNYVLTHSDPKAKGLQQVQAQKDLAQGMFKLL